MTYTTNTIDSDVPELRSRIDIGNEKAKEIRENDDAAINFARSILKKYERITNEEGIEMGKYWQILDNHRFYYDVQETDESLIQIMQDLALHGTYEPHTTKLIEEQVKEGDVCMDIGASIGYFTLLFSRLVGRLGKVHSIEATKNQFPYLIKNIRGNNYQDIVEAHNIAAWHKEEIIDINGNANGRTQVQGKPADSVFVVTEPVNFIKMDIDGSEPNALLGLEDTIKRSPNLKMVIEYYPKYIERLGLNPKDMLDFLDKYFTYSKIEGEFTEEYYNLFCIRKTEEEVKV